MLTVQFDPLGVSAQDTYIDGTVFFTGPVSSEVVFDWTTDTTPQNVNEIYTTCVQVIHLVNGQDTLAGGRKCFDRGPF